MKNKTQKKWEEEGGGVGDQVVQYCTKGLGQQDDIFP